LPAASDVDLTGPTELQRGQITPYARIPAEKEDTRVIRNSLTCQIVVINPGDPDAAYLQEEMAAITPHEDEERKHFIFFCSCKLVTSDR